MADDQKNDDNVIKQQQNDCKSAKLRKMFDVNIDTFKVADYNNQDAKCMHFKFVDKGSINKYQIYQKTFTVKDCIKLKKDAKFELIPTPKFINLIKNCLSLKNKTHSIEFEVDNGKCLTLNITYSPDEYTEVKFILIIPAKQMSDIDLLKLRLKEAEDKITQLQNRPIRWKRAVAQNPKSTTDKTTYATDKYLVSITLPPKAGKYLCQFSFWTVTSKTWCYYWFKQHATCLGSGHGGQSTPVSGTSYFNVSGMAIVNLNGNENEQKRTIRVYASGHPTHQATFTNATLVCEELVAN